MRYEPVKLRHVVELYYHRDRPSVPVKERHYFQVRSETLGTCGHRHRSEAAAKPCLSRMEAEWSRQRSELSRMAAERRRGVGH